MRSLSSSECERLKGSTTLCHCWKLVLKDGTTLGFTDHDADLFFDKLLFRSATGFTGSEAEHSLGFAIGGSEVSGVLTSDAITAADIDSGRYDGASVETWWTDWSNLDLRILLDAGTIGEIRRTEFGFTAEIRSLAQLFDMPKGRFFSPMCSAQFGDQYCKIRPIMRSSHVLQVGSDHECYVAAVDLPADSLVSGFLIRGSSKFRIRQHVVVAEKIYLRFWNKVSPPLLTGDEIQLESACNKSRQLCDALYGNIENFRGFPLMPSAQTVLMPPDAATQPLDGGSLLQ
jgi:uncharacterized phage protein (TIGR02218 family)